MAVIKVSKLKAQKVKLILFKENIFDNTLTPISDKDYVYFPIKTDKLPSSVLKIIKNPVFVKMKLKPIKQILTLKKALSEFLSKDELKRLKTSYDMLGDMAIIEIDESSISKEKLIGETLLKINPNLKTVAKKVGIHSGVFRLQKLKVIAGKKSKIVEYKENNIRLRFNPEDTYFSQRLSTERKRISKLIRPNEIILVMFSGVAPYPIVFSKNTLAKEIIGIEINPKAHKFGLDNIKLNKLSNIILYNGDVKDIVPKLNMKFDRILMPLPKTADEFLDTALSVSKKGTVIHYYAFLNENEFDKAKENINLACKKNNLSCKILDIVKCGQHAPRIYRICVDFKII